MGITYRQAGVDIDAGERSVQRIKSMVRSTFRPEVLVDIGHFGGLFSATFSDYQSPVLVSSVDGVGTKLKVAVMMNRHDTVGEDLVNHCLNDILTLGAEPLFFLDYLSLGKVTPEVVTQLIAGIVRGCKAANCALIGGETAEMTDLYQPGEYDLAGTIVGVVEKTKIITGENIEAGDVLVGLPANGLHTNGYTLARKVFFEVARYDVNTYLDDLSLTVGEALLQVHRCYLSVIRELKNNFQIKGLAHVTGGGIVGNTKRLLPQGLDIHIDWGAWEIPPIFKIIQQLGNVPVADMRRTFNLGIGYVVIIASQHVDALLSRLRQLGERGIVIGRIIKN
ncbi:phosphoribosylformylglycinamidine cyclo-ligase [candidate division KSB1 bacterium]|nr:MAG: phosphoribosylformylglycinamidine cyclo-ligase [candidate division KSB1 bacterium]